MERLRDKGLAGVMAQASAARRAILEAGGDPSPTPKQTPSEQILNDARRRSGLLGLPPERRFDDITE